MNMVRGALPGGLWVLWLCFAPVGIPFSSRVAWEKTILTWQWGPQIVGFSLMHIRRYSPFSECYVHLYYAAVDSGRVYAIRRPGDISILDALMLMCSVFITVAIVLPDTFFAAKWVAGPHHHVTPSTPTRHTRATSNLVRVGATQSTRTSTIARLRGAKVVELTLGRICNYALAVEGFHGLRLADDLSFVLVSRTVN